ncbi:hypothetical protein BB560_003837 [Smittium megazygosporum]|uniref:Nuclear speckle splicing regulatory protein 1 N-terminal domain-containing protein n=1 Tax=Smittium megazygosporum TaxID=133381 RepID=A0A2T9ZAU3_9FUNG|nr:hypothetical protein BB560_003837 [Smittium megazygosporum]
MKKQKTFLSKNGAPKELKYGLNLTKPYSNVAFFGEDDDEPSLEDQKNLNLSKSSKVITSTKSFVVDEEPIDPSAYAYDEVYDLMKQKNNKNKQPASEKEAESKEDPGNINMTSFYNNMLSDYDSSNAAATTVSTSLDILEKEKTSNSDVRASGSIEAKTQAEILEEQKRIAAKHGESLLVNLDNKIIDKRQLLSAGLNIPTKAKTHKGSSTKESERNTYQKRPDVSESERNKNERTRRGNAYTKEIERQLLSRKQKIQHKEEQDIEKIASKFSKKNDAKSISDAKLRYEQRKKQAQMPK